MSLSDLTSRDAVLAALREFDQRGRDEFLSSSGFAPSRGYFLEHQGVRYDSKAIAGVAHGIQHPHLGPLRASSFSGGEATVKKVLEGLGFTVLRIPLSDSAAWALCANPARYRIREAVQHLAIDYWLVGRARIRTGDMVAVWQTRDQRGQRGVIALGQVVGEPENRSDRDNPYWVNEADAASEGTRIPVRYQPLQVPLWVDDTAAGRFLASLTVARAKGGTVFHVSDGEWMRMVKFAGGFATVDSVVGDVEAAVRSSNSPFTGQGFGLAAAERVAVERYAMERAVEYFSSRWASVKDVSNRCSFDLLCSSAATQLRVEVKGTTSAGDSVVLTKKEIDEAAAPGYALFMVSDVILERTSPPVARGGQCRIIPRWRPDKHTLKPIAYSVNLDWSEGDSVDFSTPVDA